MSAPAATSTSITAGFSLYSAARLNGNESPILALTSAPFSTTLLTCRGRRNSHSDPVVGHSCGAHAVKKSVRTAPSNTERIIGPSPVIDDLLSFSMSVNRRANSFVRARPICIVSAEELSAKPLRPLFWKDHAGLAPWNLARPRRDAPVSRRRGYQMSPDRCIIQFGPKKGKRCEYSTHPITVLSRS